jgi:hypothetical protein
MVAAPRYRTNYGLGQTCNASENPTVINDATTPYYKCPSLGNPNAGMKTSTNNTSITKKMLYAQNIRVATETKNVKKAYAVNEINRFGRWSGAPGGFGASISNSF